MRLSAPLESEVVVAYDRASPTLGLQPLGVVAVLSMTNWCSKNTNYRGQDAQARIAMLHAEEIRSSTARTGREQDRRALEWNRTAFPGRVLGAMF